jgi:hypothetical protein
MSGLKNGNPRHTLTVEEQRRGGQKSAETRARRKTIREAFEAICSERYTDEHGNEIDGITAMCMKQFQLAMNGDTKAFVEIRNSLGEQPVQRVEVDTIDPQARAEMDELLGLNE